ncbi:MAG: phytanoyl-CoA dioxygenase family protein [Proteobacteria bacterium]|nr:phytanoyl-CoA dioxygenase family protein [Pseudomonadota bacterium]
MTWIVSISDFERNASALSPSTLQAAQAALHENGCVLLRGVFPQAGIDYLRESYESDWGRDETEMAIAAKRPAPNPVLRVGEKRYEVLVKLSGAFANPMLFANPLLHPFLASELGSDMRISGVTAVASYPGAELQRIHSDNAYLFEQDEVSTNLPTYAINVAIPLIDVDQSIGPTAVCLGSHRWPEKRPVAPEQLVSVDIRRGDCLLIDYRTKHSGMPNRSTVARPILYIVYARNWFFDEVNHMGRPSLNMPLEDFAALPDPVKPLLSRAYSLQMRARYLFQT